MQMVDNARVVVYLMAGFLESGKTSFLRYTLSQEYFEIDGNTLLILCEEGEEEYGEALLKRTNTTLLTVDDPEEMPWSGSRRRIGSIIRSGSSSSATACIR